MCICTSIICCTDCLQDEFACVEQEAEAGTGRTGLRGGAASPVERRVPRDSILEEDSNDSKGSNESSEPLVKLQYKEPTDQIELNKSTYLDTQKSHELFESNHLKFNEPKDSNEFQNYIDPPKPNNSKKSNESEMTMECQNFVKFKPLIECNQFGDSKELQEHKESKVINKIKQPKDSKEKKSNNVPKKSKKSKKAAGCPENMLKSNNDRYSHKHKVALVLECRQAGLQATASKRKIGAVTLAAWMEDPVNWEGSREEAEYREQMKIKTLKEKEERRERTKLRKLEKKKKLIVSLEKSDLSELPLSVLSRLPKKFRRTGKVEMKVKRGPGRPRKHPLPPAPTAAEQKPDRLRLAPQPCSPVRSTETVKTAPPPSPTRRPRAPARPRSPSPDPAPRPARLSCGERQFLPYSLAELVWNSSHTTNTAGLYCYCGGPGAWHNRMVPCVRCHQVRISVSSFPNYCKKNSNQISQYI